MRGLRGGDYVRRDHFLSSFSFDFTAAAFSASRSLVAASSCISACIARFSTALFSSLRIVIAARNWASLGAVCANAAGERRLIEAITNHFMDRPPLRRY